MKIENDEIFVSDLIVGRYLLKVDDKTSKDSSFSHIKELKILFFIDNDVSELLIRGISTLDEWKR